jgi:hypothetical protein
MKEIIILLSFIIAPVFSYCQPTMGYSKKEVEQKRGVPTRKEVEEKIDSFSYEEEHKGYPYTETYVFNKKDICYGWILTTRDANMINGLIDIYNKKYFIISKTEWNSFLEGTNNHINYTIDYNPKTKIYQIFAELRKK